MRIGLRRRRFIATIADAGTFKRKTETTHQIKFTKKVKTKEEFSVKSIHQQKRSGAQRKLISKSRIPAGVTTSPVFLFAVEPDLQYQVVDIEPAFKLAAAATI